MKKFFDFLVICPIAVLVASMGIVAVADEFGAEYYLALPFALPWGIAAAYQEVQNQ